MKPNKLTKILTLLLVFTMLFSLYACTGNDNNSENTTVATTTNGTVDTTVSLPDYNYTIKAMLLSGTTGMSAAKLIDDVKNNNSALKVDFEIATSTDVVASQIINGSIDIAAVPTNLASVLYNVTEGDVRVIAVSARGVLYLLENGNTITDFNSLKGKTIYVPGQGSNPEYILLHLLEKNGLTPGTDVTIDYTYSTPDALTAAVIAGIAPIAVLPEPKVTAVTTSNPDVRVALDFTVEWDKVEEQGTLVQSCLIATEKFVTENKALLDVFLSEYEASINYINENPQAASVLIQSAGIIPSAAMAESAIPRCNLVYIEGDAMEAAMNKYLGILFEANAASIGGAMPDNELYYIK